MAPHDDFSGPLTAPVRSQREHLAVRRRFERPPSNERNATHESGLTFITGTTPEEFRSKVNMAKVRKKAMVSYLENGRKSHEGQRRREGSSGSFGTDDSAASNDSLALTKDSSKRQVAREDTPTDNTYARSLTVCGSSYDSASGMPMDLLYPTPPMVPPMRSELALPYDNYQPKPFQSIGKSLDPFRTMHQSSHPQVSVEQLKWYCSRTFGTKAMGLHWVSTLIKSPHAFLSTLCIASAHYDAMQERAVESVQTIALRQEVMSLISQSLVDPQSGINDYNIAALTQLIVSELISDQESALNYHEGGVMTMIRQRGGLSKLGANTRIASTISWVSLESAILRETPPSPMYLDYHAPSASKTHPGCAALPESPLYCPRGDFDAVKKSTRCNARTFDLLKDIRMLIDLFLHETERSRQNSLSLKNIHKKIITQYPTAAALRQKEVMTPNAWRYEAIRLASVIAATAIIRREPLSKALGHAAEIETDHAANSYSYIPSPVLLRQDSPISSFTVSPSYTATSDQFNPFALSPTTPTKKAQQAASKPSETTALLAHLKQALLSSDLSDCWAEMAGVLLWLALTVATACRTADKALRKWFRALAVRASIVLCFEHPEAVHRGLLRLGELIETVSEKERPGDIVNKGSAERVVRRRRS